MKIYLAGVESRQWLLDKHVESARNGGGGVNDIKIYLAGAINGNLKPEWARTVRPPGGADDTKIYLAGNVGKEKWEAPYDVPILESYYYVDETVKAHIPRIKDFLLDSGAFTFFTSGKSVNFDKYVEEYGEFVKAFGIKLFFELDIDSIVGFDKVLQYRRRLEQITGRQPIPVWHISRGLERFKQDASEYPYVALGGIVSGEWTPAAEKQFPWFIQTAHQLGAKIHGLGYTKLAGLHKYHFDSVDSTAWTTGNRFGYLYKFNGKTMTKIEVPKGKRLSTNAAAQHNFNEWVKFQRFAEVKY